jgi:hypothetical protein
VKYAVDRAPLAIIGFEGYGLKKDNNIWKFMYELRDWFEIRDLSRDVIDTMPFVIRDVSGLEGRSVIFNEFEDRWGFSVLINMNERKEYEVPTIETVEYVPTFK